MIYEYCDYRYAVKQALCYELLSLLSVRLVEQLYVAHAEPGVGNLARKGR